MSPAETEAHGLSSHAAFNAIEALHWNPMIVSSVILILAYAFIISEKINRAIVALLGAGLMIFLGILTQEKAIEGIDFNTLALLTGMMVVVSIASKSGVFEYVAIWTAKTVKGNPRLLLAALSIVTAVFSALLDNVTTVLLVVPVTLSLVSKLNVRAYPFLFSQIFASNTGGTATLIGDPPNIMIGSALNLGFMDFIYNTAPIAIVVTVINLVIFDLIWGRKMKASDEAIAAIQALNPTEALKDTGLMKKSLGVLGLIILGFVVGHPFGYQPGTVALFGAALLLLVDNISYHAEDQAHRVNSSLSKVEWETIFFFMGLFILVYGVEEAGVLEKLGGWLLGLTDGYPLEERQYLTTMLVLWSSAVFSGIIDNIPFVATMIPLLKSITVTMGGEEAMMPIWWALAIGACLGGNGSLIGASANIIVASFAQRAGHHMTFLGFMKLAFPMMLFSVLISTVFITFMFF